MSENSFGVGMTISRQDMSVIICNVLNTKTSADKETFKDDGKISALACDCFCGDNCKHEFAAMLQLKESLELITENYEDEYNGYFAIISKDVFMNTVMNKKVSGKISLGV